jgi:hypothetical protein
LKRLPRTFPFYALFYYEHEKEKLLSNPPSASSSEFRSLGDAIEGGSYPVF